MARQFMHEEPTLLHHYTYIYFLLFRIDFINYLEKNMFTSNKPKVLASLNNCVNDTFISVIGVISMSNLKYFETFSYIGVSTRVKRFSGTKELYTQVKFKAFNRNFVLVLKSGTDVLAEGFSAQLVGPDGQMSSFHVDQNIFFSGHLLEDPEVRVAGHMEDALFSIQIFDYNVTYSIEPAVNVLHPSNNPDNHTHVAYRSCDITHRPQKCVAGLCNQQLNVEPVLTMGDFKKRFRRKVSHDICIIYLVADNDFFTHRCRRHFLHCSSLM
uniref:Uncharacterized protein n=1 Tax=Biomphalaria glabrata TaxID=6526 RepID=A0A2C9L464_BIOGL